MRTEDYIMKTQNIRMLNQAVTVLRHFVDLSGRLLPFLSEINRKRSPNAEELADKYKIIEVYSNYDFDTRTSEFLMDSNVLTLIQDAYLKLERKENAKNELRAFQKEHYRLRKSWNQIDAN